MMAASETSSFKIILGSSSMARRKILGEMGYEFTILTADIDEKSIRKEKPEELVVALAEAKADAIISRLKTTCHFEEDASSTAPTLLITADTVEEGIMLNVAGDLMLEHPLTLPFIDIVVGTADSVMGLSKALTEKLIQEAL